MMKRPYYMVLRLADDASPVYVFASQRKFTVYREAQLFTQNLSVNHHPIIVMIA